MGCCIHTLEVEILVTPRVKVIDIQVQLMTGLWLSTHNMNAI